MRRDGLGLAIAISEHILEVVGCPTLFATHFHELNALVGERKCLGPLTGEQVVTTGMPCKQGGQELLPYM